LQSARPPRRSPLRSATGQDVQHVPDRLLAIGKFRQGQVALHLITIPTTFSLFDDVSAICQIGHYGVRVSLRDAEVRCDLAQTNIRILRDAKNCAAVVRQEAPSGHSTTIPYYIEIGC